MHSESPTHVQGGVLEESGDGGMQKVRRICTEVGLELLPINRRPGAGQTTAAATLYRIYRAYGQGHLILLLRTLLEIEGRAQDDWAVVR